PVVGADQHRGAVRDLDRHPAPVGADARVHHGEDHPGAQVLHRPGQGQPAGAHVEGRDVVGDVDDGDLGAELPDHRVDDADELVRAPVVGEERDRVVSERHGAPTVPPDARPGGAGVGNRQPPSSRERAAAAATASMSAARTARSSSTRTPAAVVPPGEVTAARSASGPCSPSASSRAAPRIVWRTRASAVGRGSPASTPASMRASATRKTYAGPEPDRPATASSDDPGTSTTVPTAPRIERAHSASPGPAWAPSDIAAAPSPTSAGVFGIARTTGTPAPAASSSAMSGTPAAIDSTRRSPTAAAPRSASRASGGLVATMTPSDSTGDAVTVTPGNVRSSSPRRASEISTTATASGRTTPAPRRPPRSASAMRPPPRSSSSNMGCSVTAGPRGPAASPTAGPRGPRTYGWNRRGSAGPAPRPRGPVTARTVPPK